VQPSLGPLTLVVRVSSREAGALRGTVERVRTGEKHRFRDVGELTAIVARLAEGEEVASLPGGTD
jgi:hypothetical protein